VYVNGNVIVTRGEEIASSALTLRQFIRSPAGNSDCRYQVAPNARSWQFENSQRIVIPERDIVARGICGFAAGSKQIPRR
jgi:hypothetical protein